MHHSALGYALRTQQSGCNTAVRTFVQAVRRIILMVLYKSDTVSHVLLTTIDRTTQRSTRCNLRKRIYFD